MDLWIHKYMQFSPWAFCQGFTAWSLPNSGRWSQTIFYMCVTVLHACAATPPNKPRACTPCLLLHCRTAQYFLWCFDTAARCVYYLVSIQSWILQGGNWLEPEGTVTRRTILQILTAQDTCSANFDNHQPLRFTAKVVLKVSVAHPARAPGFNSLNAV